MDSVTEAIRRQEAAIRSDGVMIEDVTDELLNLARVAAVGPFHDALVKAADEIDRLQDAKRRALQIADERSKENSALRQQLVSVQKALLLFRTFTIGNATQWKMGTNHHHPIWQLVAESLGDMNGDEVRDGPDWQMVSPLTDD